MSAAPHAAAPQTAALQTATLPGAAHRRFRCPACGSLMVYGAARCGDCNEEAPVYNRPLFWWMLWPCLGLGIAGLVAALLI